MLNFLVSGSQNWFIYIFSGDSFQGFDADDSWSRIFIFARRRTIKVVSIGLKFWSKWFLRENQLQNKIIIKLNLLFKDQEKNKFFRMKFFLIFSKMRDWPEERQTSSLFSREMSWVLYWMKLIIIFKRQIYNWVFI